MSASNCQQSQGMGSRRAASASALIGLWLSCFHSPVFGDGPSAQIARLLDNLPQKQATCGAVIVDLESNRPLLTRAETTPMVPASNQKVLILAAAAEMLGRDATFRTILAVRGADLLVIGSGDPALGDESLAEARGQQPLAFLDRWSNALATAGHRSISGDFIVDTSIFDQQFVHPMWEEGDLVKWYGAPVGGLNLCDNCVQLTVWPAEVGGAIAQWSIFPACPLVSVANECTSAPGSTKAVPTVARRPYSFDLVLRGRTGARGRLQAISIPRPDLFAATAIREHLATKGIRVAGKLSFQRVRDDAGEIPPDCTIIAEAVTPLPDVLRRIGLDSQNMFAEALFKRLGYEWARKSSGAPAVGSWENGRHAVGDLLERAGCDPATAVVSDGSGLSRDNRISAADMVRVLAYMHRHKERDLFVSSLAGNRTGGSLQRRMTGIDGDVYAKTGYMRGVRALSGYVKAANERWYAFCILFNGFRGSSAPYNKIHQEVCRILADISDDPAS